MADPSMATILVKMRSPAPELTPVEAIRWEKYQMNLLDIWAMAYMRHRDDLLSLDQWESWDGYFSELFKDGGEKLSRLRWEQLEYGYDHGFWEHMGEAIFGR